MCLPAAPLALAAAAMSAAGTVAGGYQQMQQGKYDSALNKRNAAMEVDAARDSIETGKDEARNFYRDVARTKGDQIAAMAANGLDLSFGTPTRIEGDTEMLSREDANSLYKGIHRRTQGSLINAGNYMEAAKAARSAGKNAFYGSLASGAMTLAGGAAQYKGQREKLGQSGWF